MTKIATFILVIILGLTLTPGFVSAAETKPAAALLKVASMAAVMSGPVSALGTSTLTVNGVTVNIANTTVLLRRFEGKAEFSEFSVGDQVHVVGKYTDTNKTAINAKLVRNLSIQKRHGTFMGQVQTVTTTGFTLQTLNRGVQTITTTIMTKYQDRKGAAISVASIVSGHKVMVKGLWNNKLNTITEVAVVKDFSLPSTPAKTPQTLPKE